MTGVTTGVVGILAAGRGGGTLGGCLTGVSGETGVLGGGGGGTCLGGTGGATRVGSGGGGACCATTGVVGGVGGTCSGSHAPAMI
jgi:hypothetical protein